MRVFRVLILLVLLGAAWFGFLRRPSAPEGATPAQGPAQAPAPIEPLQVERQASEPTPAAARPSGDPGSRWTEQNNRATQALRDGDLQEAVRLFSECFEAEPGNDVFRSNLGEALVRYARSLHEERDATELAIAELAIDELERALEVAPEREDRAVLETILARWRRELEVEENHWVEGSDLFELSYDTDRTDILQSAQDVLDHLEASYEDLRLWFAFDPVREGGRKRIKVGLYNRHEFDRLTGLGHWAGGVFDGVVRVSIEDLESERRVWARVLKHELVHAFLHEIGGTKVPGWLNEGLAQWMEGAGLSSRMALARERLRSRELFSLERMQGTLATWKDTTAIELAYAQSLLLVDFLLEQYGESTLRHMIAGCADGTSVEETFRERHGFELATTLEDLRATLAH